MGRFEARVLLAFSTPIGMVLAYTWMNFLDSSENVSSALYKVKDGLVKSLGESYEAKRQSFESAKESMDQIRRLRPDESSTLESYKNELSSALNVYSNESMSHIYPAVNDRVEGIANGLGTIAFYADPISTGVLAALSTAALGGVGLYMARSFWRK